MVDLDKLERVLELMTKYGVDVVQVESPKERFAVAKNAGEAHFFERSARAVTASTPMPPSSGDWEGAQPGQVSTTPAAASQPQARQAAAPKTAVAGSIQTSELVGTFYRAPSPTSASFVDVGSRVKKGQTLCIVEAMKIMNEIESEFDGEIVEILVENGKPVEFGTPLFRIKTS